jgi:uncharacterized protein
MRVNIDEIKEGGLDRAWDLSQKQVDDAVRGDAAGYRAQGSAHVEAHLDRLSRRVLLRARSRTELSAPCGRCLALVRVPVPIDFSLTLVPADRDADGKSQDGGKRRSGSFTVEQVDEELFSGKEIDLDPIVREQLLLALPPYPLCRESCKGLCPVCGRNLNDAECGCDRRAPDPRWAGLEKFRTKSKQ